MSRSRSFCFTVNNYEVATETQMGDCCTLALWANMEDWIRYMIMGLETAPTTGTPHIQGYMYLEEPISLRSLISRFPVQAHISIARDNPATCSNYCRKEDEDP